MATRIEYQDQVLELAPDIGGSVMRFDWKGQSILRPSPAADDPVQTAAFPMIPFSGRVENGQFEFNGEEISLALNFPPEPHAIHGQCWKKPWQIEAQDEKAITLLSHNDGADWPWRYGARQRFELTESGLHLRMELKNLSGRPMPAGFGWHPFFPKRDAILSADTTTFWPRNTLGLPTGPEPVDTSQDLRAGKQVEPLRLDDVFETKERSATISWPKSQIAVSITSSSVFPFLIVFTPDEDFFCVEPATHTPNALNADLTHDVTGLRVLKPNEVLAGTITLSPGYI